MSQPQVPPRPQRAQGGPTAVSQNTPQIPPRPVRKADPSPIREANTRSPFNEPPTAMSNGKVYGHSNLSASDLPARPPSVSSMPTIGQEGIEYASYDQLPPEAHGASANDSETVQQTRHADVPMLQPTASVPQSTAKSRISAVTRTDSSQAAAAGLGRSRADDDRNDSSTSLGRMSSREPNRLSRVSSREPHPLRAKSSFNQSSTSLPGEHADDEEQGIPEIGMQVPMYKNAGDVQAPSPSPYAAQFPAGIGFFNDGSARNHHRKRSSRQEFGPPGSYGLHGHPGQAPADQFERDWMAKHPDIAAKEGYNAYGGLSPRPPTALSSDQLNRLVRENHDVGMGASPDAVGTPSQEIGWEASEQYTSRLNSPRNAPSHIGEHKKRPSSGTQPPIASPLRTAAIPDISLDSEDDTVIHVDGKVTRGSKVTGGGEKDNKFDLNANSGNTSEAGWIDERGPGTPILASDEIVKRPSSAFMQPAVSPEAERTEFLEEMSRRGSGQPTSRPTSRPNSMHGGVYGSGLHRFISHDEHQGSGHGTPLEEIEEYEPLFPDDDEKNKASMAEKLKKRPGLAQHHFPSQDVWEDTPASLQFTTSVETPEPPQEPASATDAKPASAVFESPEQEQRRRDQNPEGMISDHKTFSKPHFKSGVADEIAHGRPGIQRFPSQDIWEDTPDSMRLETTVSAPQEEEVRSPEERPTTTILTSGDDTARASTGFSQLMRPQIPARPKQRSKLAQEITPEIASSPPEKSDPREQEVPDLGAKATSPSKGTPPTIPDRPKPTVPARPARHQQPEAAKSPSFEEPPAVPKAKPAVPARPAGNKFSNLKSGFMSDLASRLQSGPQGPPPKVQEPEPELAAEEEKAPLADARKSRAKGPARRKPASSPSAQPKPAAAPVFAFSTPVTVWSIDDEDVLSVPTSTPAAPVSEAEKTLTAAVRDSPASSASASTPGVGPETPLERENPLGTPATKAVDAPVSATSVNEDSDVKAHAAAQVGSEGDVPESSLAPPASAAAAQEEREVKPVFEEALKGAEPAPKNAEEAHEIGEKARAEKVEDEVLEQTNEIQGVSGYSGTKDPGSEGNVVVRDGEEVARGGAD